MTGPSLARRAQVLTGLALAASSTLTLLLTASPATAQAWPAKPLRFVAPVAPGGDMDFVTRLVAKKVGDALGQPIAVENRVGAGGQIASDFIAKAAPDGYTYGVIFTSHMSNPALYARLPYDSLKDFEFVSLMTTTPVVMAVPASMPVNTLTELIAWSKANPGKLNYATGSTADVGHITAARLILATGMNATHIPYKGAAPALTDLLGGQINMIVTPPPVVAQHVQSGRLKALALSSAQRTAAMPGVPTIAESINDKSFDMASFYALVAPAGTPRDIVERISNEVRRAVQAPDTVEIFRSRGNVAVGSTPAELRSFIENGVQRIGTIIRQAGIKPE